MDRGPAFPRERAPRLHVNAFAQLPKPAWDEQVARLEQAIPTLAANRIQAEFMMLVASLGDSHTMLRPGPLFQPGVPLRLVAWPDGMRVFGIAGQHRALLGAQLVAVGGRNLAEIEKSLARVIAADNAGARQAQMPMLLTRPNLLRALGLAEDGATIRYEFAPTGGGRVELAVPPPSAWLISAWSDGMERAPASSRIPSFSVPSRSNT